MKGLTTHHYRVLRLWRSGDYGKGSIPTLPAPSRPDRTLPEVKVTAILATEPNPPPGEAPVEWLLLTNLPVETPSRPWRS
jgi:hypothetical protein